MNKPGDFSESFINDKTKELASKLGFYPHLKQSVLQRGLRDMYNLHVNVIWNGRFDYYVKVTPLKILNKQPEKQLATYEEALEEALQFALNYLLNEKATS